MSTFDYNFYTTFYKDLSKLTYNNALKHWRNHGQKEGRICSAQDIKKYVPVHFDYKYYANNYDDVKNLTEIDIYKHWLAKGRAEKRSYSPTKTVNELNIYYFCPSLYGAKYNTGVQRVTRLLAKHLNSITNLYFVDFNHTTNSFTNASSQGIENVKLFNGISGNINTVPDLDMPNKMLFIVEPINHLYNLTNILKTSKTQNMKVACIFYDDTPIKCYKKEAITGFSGYIKDILHTDFVFPISLYSYSRLVNYYKKGTTEDNPKATIIPCSLATEFIERPRVHKYKTIKPGNYTILCVSTISRRKNQVALINAINKLLLPIKLILVGSIFEQDYYEEIKKLTATNNNIVHYPNITDSQLDKLYSEADLTVYPSLEEGFGLPIAESIWNCRPCICMNYGAMAEVSKSLGGCLTVDCNNTDKLSKAIRSILTDKAVRNRLISEINNAKFRTWQEYTQDIVRYLSA